MSKQLMVLAGCIVLSASVASAGLLGVPAKYTPEKSWPVIVSTQDNPDPELTKKTDYFLVHAGGQGSACTKNIREDLLSLAAKYNIDPFRIYGTGFSRGGQEIEIQAWQRPDWFAAIAPVCSDLREKPDRNERHLNVQYLQNVPTLMLHGDGDSFRESGEIEFELAKKAGVPVTWATYEGGHSPAGPFKQNVKLLTDFFDKHKLDPNPKEVTHVVESNRLRRAFWVDCSLVKETPTVRGVYKVKIKEGNIIAVETNEHIATLAFALNDKLVDMKKPVKVVAGDKTLYEGPAKESLVVKIRDGEAYTPTEEKPLWQEIQAVRAKAAEGKTDKPAEGKTEKPAEVKADRPADPKPNAK